MEGDVDMKMVFMNVPSSLRKLKLLDTYLVCQRFVPFQTMASLLPKPLPDLR